MEREGKQDREEREHISPGKSNPWNKREKQSQFLLYLLVGLVCLILAYVLSGAAK